MSDVTLTVSISASKGGQSINSVGSTGAAARSFDMAGADMSVTPQVTSTTTAAVTVPAAVGMPAHLMIANLEPSGGNSVNIDTVTPVVNGFLLKPGRSMMVEVASGATVYVKAAAGAPSIAVWWCEE